MTTNTEILRGHLAIIATTAESALTFEEELPLPVRQKLRHILKLAQDRSPAFETGTIRAVPAAYAMLVESSGFRAVSIAALHHAVGGNLLNLQDWLRAEWQAGRVVLSVGDWSLASEQERAAHITLLGEKMLQVRFL